MIRRFFHSLLISSALLAIPSCGLIMAPFNLAGAVVEGTYKVGEKVVTAPIDAYGRRQERKEAEKEKMEKEQAKAGRPTTPGSTQGQPTPLPELPPLPGGGELPPIPPPN
ncbi:MAG: hypothetical protein CFE26_09575 [Verrucomicrobiales bacterium VVV1]|nr:MAG: hypothetical protein CFE26_09575 [Verrucomicrobiales bacterium VVV1]